MTAADAPLVLPYSKVVGHSDLKLALELCHLSPGIGGVLVSGERGTAKSTVVRSFAVMAHGALPVTLPLNATDDRVVGGWRLDALMEGRVQEQRGLLEEATERGMLYVDEVNLLDDHIVNIILDGTSTGVLTVQRDGMDQERRVSFALVGTMNPEEGGLRPQLLDRFGLMVNVRAEQEPQARRDILRTVLELDRARAVGTSDFLAAGRDADRRRRLQLAAARDRLYEVNVGPEAVALCAAAATAFGVAGHRGDIVTVLAARALAARDGDEDVQRHHVLRVAPLALCHRRPAAAADSLTGWTPQDQATLVAAIDEAA